MYKVTNDLLPAKEKEIFQLREESHCNLHYTSQSIIPPIGSVYNRK